MAIQVNGTQVIGNSRELTNIASVDATTVAAMAAAGVGGANILATDTINVSQTYTFRATGTVIIQAIGAGGSGSIFATNNAASGKRASSSGGAAGGYVRKSVAVTQGDTISITIGAGGARVPQTSGNEQSNGSAGGTTTVTGSNLGSGNTSISLTAGGGGGGLMSGANSYGDSSVASNTGGSASGGDVNNTGGTTSVTTNSSNYTWDQSPYRYGLCRGASPTIFGNPEAVTVALNADQNITWIFRGFSSGSYTATAAAEDAAAYGILRSSGFTDANQTRIPLGVYVQRNYHSSTGSYLSDNALQATVGAQPYVGAGGPGFIVNNIGGGISYAAGAYGANGAVFITYKDE